MGVVLRMPDATRLRAAQLRWCRYVLGKVRIWVMTRKMPARSGNFERARQIADSN